MKSDNNKYQCQQFPTVSNENLLHHYLHKILIAQRILFQKFVIADLAGMQKFIAESLCINRFIINNS